MGLLTELREAAPLAERLAKAAEAAEEHFGKAVAAAEAGPQGPDPGRPPGSQPPVPPPPVGPPLAPQPPASSGFQAPTASSSSGGDSGGGGGRTLPPRKLRSTNAQFVQSEDWIGEHCTRRDPIDRIPNPRNRNARRDDDFVDIGGWDCSEEFGYPAIFYDPDEMAALEGRGPGLSSKGSGGSRGAGGRAKRGPRSTEILQSTGYDLPSTRALADGSSAPALPPSPPSSQPSTAQSSVVAEATLRTLGEQTRLLREIRDQGRIGDASLAQRVGGRP